MLKFEEEKDTLTKKLSEQYSKSTVTMEEYERILEYINKIETKKEISIIEKIIDENGANNSEITVPQASVPQTAETHTSVFSWRASTVKSVNERYIAVFGAHQIIVDDLPKGRTIIDVESAFSLTEIIVPKNVKVTTSVMPFFSGIFMPGAAAENEPGAPELYIRGNAFFSNITIKRND
ncbi:hypothetical protein FACS1894147_13050 [Spirochaetia bacterium]|nr:hypothetical protein FACS1894147_13050 [Spirochaetia bacterium]